MDATSSYSCNSNCINQLRNKTIRDSAQKAVDNPVNFVDPGALEYAVPRILGDTYCES